MRQATLWADDTSSASSGTFTPNLGSAVHRWFRYSPGFAADWVAEVIASRRARHVLDPFAGSGTALIEAQLNGADSIGLESHPFAARIARAKLAWSSPPQQLQAAFERTVRVAGQLAPDITVYPELIRRCFPPEVLTKLDRLRRAIGQLEPKEPAAELLWLALASVLRSVSPVGTASWQYVLPNRSKKSVREPLSAFRDRVQGFVSDMLFLRSTCPQPSPARVLAEDARCCSGVADAWADLVVTSPPYANNFDYADFTRLEMSFFMEVRGWGELHHAVRRHLVRSCTQHVSAERLRLRPLLALDELAPIRKELATVTEALSAVKEERGGRKPYDLMIAAYFADMALVWGALRRVCRPGACVVFVIGDSAPYGVHVPVERWLGELALAAGFWKWSFVKIRDRNTKWRNRKHTVLLKEGCLWVEG